MCARQCPGAPRFWPARVTDLDIAKVLATVEARVARLLERRGLAARDEEGGDAWEEMPLLGGLAAASVRVHTQTIRKMTPHPGDGQQTRLQRAFPALGNLTARFRVA